MKRSTILLVDDDKDDQVIFTTVINEIDNNIEVEGFDNAEQALKTLETRDKTKPDCIFLDLNLPYMHGFDFLHLLKTSHHLNNIPVIIYSTSTREADKIKAKELGAANFLSKPTSFIELKTKLTGLLTDVCNCD
jgi:DNA-binding response OmpR family regulator